MKVTQFNNKTILITGANSGIGEAITLLLAQSSANLFLTGRNVERLKAVGEKCETIRKSLSGQSDCSIRLFDVDFSAQQSIDLFVETLLKECVFFDYMILNAGISQRSLTLETDFAVDRAIMETNFFGPVYFTKRLTGMLLNGKPVHISITSSISGLFGFPLRSAYCASKHALFGFYEALELENPSIKVTFLIPGRINTPISQNALIGDGSTYSMMDVGQANGMDVNKCARIALRAIHKGKHRQLIGGKDLLMVYLKKFAPPLFYWLARKVSAT